MTASSDFLPTASLDVLRVRAAALREVRQFFDARGSLEVETPILSHDIVVDAWLEPFVTSWAAEGDPAGTAGTHEMFLQTSPEFAMKRLLAAGATSLYQVTHAFRNGERGRLHNPEFTMIEWYRVGDDHHAQMEFVEQLVCTVQDAVSLAAADLGIASAQRSAWQAPFLRTAYDAAFERHAGGRVLVLSARELGELAARHGLVAPPGLANDDRDGWLNYLLAELVEPKLGQAVPEFLYDYPASQAALARVRPGPPAVAERFELYVQGVEICNGYHELVDADELRERIARQQALRVRDGRRALPAASRLLVAMEAGLPACAGVALGFDRLLMMCLGASDLDAVLPFPFERA